MEKCLVLQVHLGLVMSKMDPETLPNSYKKSASPPEQVEWHLARQITVY